MPVLERPKRSCTFTVSVQMWDLILEVMPGATRRQTLRSLEMPGTYSLFHSVLRFSSLYTWRFLEALRKAFFHSTAQSKLLSRQPCSLDVNGFASLQNWLDWESYHLSSGKLCGYIRVVAKIFVSNSKASECLLMKEFKRKETGQAFVSWQQWHTSGHECQKTDSSWVVVSQCDFPWEIPNVTRSFLLREHDYCGGKFFVALFRQKILDLLLMSQFGIESEGTHFRPISVWLQLFVLRTWQVSFQVCAGNFSRIAVHRFSLRDMVGEWLPIS